MAEMTKHVMGMDPLHAVVAFLSVKKIESRLHLIDSHH